MFRDCGAVEQGPVSWRLRLDGEGGTGTGAIGAYLADPMIEAGIMNS